MSTPMQEMTCSSAVQNKMLARKRFTYRRTGIQGDLRTAAVMARKVNA
jgi:hypothetical protein